VSLRTRIAGWTAVAVVLTVLAVIVVARQAAAGSLVAAVDDDLRTLSAMVPQAATEGRLRSGGGLGELRGMGSQRGRHAAMMLGAEGILTVLDDSGTPIASGPQVPLPVTPAAAAVARGEATQVAETVTVDGERLRVLTLGLSGGGAVQLARSLAEVDDALGRLTGWLAVIGAIAALLAGGLALVLADRLTRPVRRLTDAAEEVAATQQLTTRIAPAGDDELARLGRSFDAMLASLEQAREAQTQLVADASHELRTPLTSLRTNIDLLRSGASLPDDDHRRLLADLGEQLEEFGRLVDGLVELARGEQPPLAPVPVRMDELVADVARSVARDHPDADLELQFAAWTVVGDAGRLARAVRNLLVNAVVHGGGHVEVTVTDGALRVRDHGPGIADPDRTRVLARFYRSPEARSRPGSGLGLAIVEQVARTHGGTIRLEPAPGGGTLAVLTLASAASVPSTPATDAGR
jgi:two-component system, OmpR family, sensor histidine kinase MprB